MWKSPVAEKHSSSALLVQICRPPDLFQPHSDPEAGKNLELTEPEKSTWYPEPMRFSTSQQDLTTCNTKFTAVAWTKTKQPFALASRDMDQLEKPVSEHHAYPNREAAALDSQRTRMRCSVVSTVGTRMLKKGTWSHQSRTC